ncbi:MAG: hypothetical protein EPO02_12770 [Nitrospirae bacterium]|nr:MAG: hypothetical protein EPO02_12770 [Nitrospirota bacterium]
MKNEILEKIRDFLINKKDEILQIQKIRIDEMEALIKRNELTWNNAKLLEEYSSCSLASASMHFIEKFLEE